MDWKKGCQKLKVNINNKELDMSVWAIVALAGVVLTTALEGSGLTMQDLTTWGIVFKTISNVVANPVKVVTITLAVLAYFLPRPHYTQEDDK